MKISEQLRRLPHPADILNKGSRRQETAFGEMEADQLQRRALRSILLLLIAGMLLLICDLAVSQSARTIGIEKDDGKFYLIRPAEEDPEGHLSMKAEVSTDSGVCSEDLNVTLSPYRSKEDPSADAADDDAPRQEEDLIRTELRGLASDLDSDRSKRRIPLPDSLSSGQTIRWSLRRESNTMLILCLTLAGAAAIYVRRMAPLKKRQKAREEAILRSLPEFINQLVLLLNAGLVLSRAFDRTVEESMKFHAPGSDWFYLQMKRICDSVQNTNGSITAEFHAFAKESGVRELLRISSILRDNISKGASLNEKLERESESLWISRRLRFEEQGRLAETKMTLPLSIFLCVLIIITVAPALLTL